MRQHAVLFISFLFLFGLTSCSTDTEVLETALLERQGLVYEVNSDTPFTGLAVSYYLNNQYKYKKNYKDGKQHGLYEEFYRNGQLHVKENYKDGKVHGPVERFYENGQLQGKANLRDGELHGPAEAFYENGQLQVKRNYKNGKDHGPFEWFYENGQLEAKGNFKDGKQHGLFEEFYENGQLQAKENYEDGKEHGPFELFYEDGQLQARWNAKDGKNHGPLERFYEDGQLQVKANWEDGKKHGLYEEFHEDGQLQAKWNYENGKEHGPFELFYEDGQLQVKENWKDGKKHGLYEQFHEDGQLQAKWNYENGKEHGPFELFYDNGQLQAKANYKDGEQHGLVEWFDEDGNLTAKENYPEEPGLAADERLLAYEREYAAVKARQHEMVSIPGGTFRMGDLSGEGRYNERPVHSVTVPAFRLGKYEVTFAQWDACVADGGCDGYSPDDAGGGRGNRPVINISWDDIQTYIAWLNGRTGGNYRLPTEAEWEYAARAGSTTLYSWGDDIGSNRANCNDDCGDSYEYAAPVGSFPANAWGLHDMHGNVWEWVQDCWNESYQGAPTDGSAWESGVCGQRVFRGSSWKLNARSLRSAYRGRSARAARSYLLGFRLAQDQ